MKSTDLRFAEAIRRVREARGMTQAELAERAKVTRTHLVRIEAGHNPRQGVRARLQGALGFTLGEDLLIAAALGKREKFVGATETKCVACGSRTSRKGPRGRPPKRCSSCQADHAAVCRAWRAANPDRVAAYNAARRRKVA